MSLSGNCCVDGNLKRVAPADELGLPEDSANLFEAFFCKECRYIYQYVRLIMPDRECSDVYCNDSNCKPGMVFQRVDNWLFRPESSVGHC
jgi:hypothetical protein